jgi:hypothetical protein
MNHTRASIDCFAEHIRIGHIADDNLYSHRFQVGQIRTLPIAHSARQNASWISLLLEVLQDSASKQTRTAKNKNHAKPLTFSRGQGHMPPPKP